MPATTPTTNNSSSTSKTITVAAVEGGGTSFRLAVCQFQDDHHSSDSYDMDSCRLPPPARIVAQVQIDSSHDRPQETLAQCAAFFKEHLPSPDNSANMSYDGLGIATFGPVGLKRDGDDDTTYGHILSTTPKAAWRNVDILTPLQAACGCSNDQVWVETDVNAPALSEYLLYNHEKKNQQSKKNAKKNENTISSLAYITVGTGVGVGLVVNDKCVHGRMHPEGGHVPIRPLENDTFTGYSWGVDHCPFHGKFTVEGVASSVALVERLLQKQQQEGITADDTTTGATTATADRSILSQLSDDDETWDHAANALASLCATLLLLLSVERIVLGGGVLKRAGLLEKIQKRTVVLLNGYLALPPSSLSSSSSSSNKNTRNDHDDDKTMTLEQLITTSVHGDNAGLQGAIVLAQRAYYQGRGNRYSFANSTTSRHYENDENDKSLLETKRQAFQIGWTYGVLVGAVGTALLMRYAAIMTGRRR